MSNEWGYGRLNIYQALFDEAIEDERTDPQIIEVKVSREMVDEDQLLVSVDYMADDNQELHWRLDANANLIWDYDWQGEATFTPPEADLTSSVSNRRHERVFGSILQ